jgi:hypothetical protein
MSSSFENVEYRMAFVIDYGAGGKNADGLGPGEPAQHGEKEHAQQIRAFGGRYRRYSGGFVPL